MTENKSFSSGSGSGGSGNKSVGAAGNLFFAKLKSKSDVLSEFKKNITEFIDELIDQFPTEGNMVMARVKILEIWPISSTMKDYIKHILPFKEAINRRDEKFFLEKDELFVKLEPKKVITFKKMWVDMDGDNKIIIFNWFKLFNGLAERYLELK